jgi:thiol:disulfide interchange protein
MTAAQHFPPRPNRLFRVAVIICAALALPVAALAQFGGSSIFPGQGQQGVRPGEEVVVSAAASRTVVSPNGQLALALVLDHAPTWHSWPSAEEDVLPDGFGFAIRTEVKLVDEPAWISHVGPTQWPTLKPAPVPNLTGSGPPTIEVPTYGGKAISYIPIIIAADAPLGTHTLQIETTFQACDDTTCLQPRTERIDVTIEIVALGEGSGADAVDVSLFEGFDESVFEKMLSGEIRRVQLIAFDAFGVKFSLDPAGPTGLALLLLVAALGGFLLNLTPCVLPVIPIKIMGLSQSAGHPGKALALGTVMSLGVIAFWVAIGLAIVSLTGFDSISSLFQRPWFAILVGVFIAAMAVGMLGVFTISLPKAAYMVNPSHESVHGSFLFGVMTAILSTPCTAPFMGTAAAWATTQESSVVMATFGAIGLGMALPYFVLSANPKWVSKVPRTGPASELVKQVMGLLMIAVAAFFLGTGLSGWFAAPPQPPSRIYWWFVAAFVVAAGLWMAWRTIRITKKPTRRVVFGGVGALLVATGLWGGVRFTDKGPIDWVYYTPERFSQAMARGEVVVVDFTAEWCLNCKALEEAVLFSDEVARVLNGAGVTPIKVDITGDNPQGRAKLKDLGRVAIPLLAVYGPGLEAPFLSDSYTREQVLTAIRMARGGEPQPPPVTLRD